MSAKPKFVFHSQVSSILQRWAEDLSSLPHSDDFERNLAIKVETICLKAWAGIANLNANGTKINPDCDLYFQLFEHCCWRFEQLKAFYRSNCVSNDFLLREVELVMSWISSCVGGNDD